MIKQMFVLTEPIKSQQFDGGVNLYCGTFAILLIGIYIFNTKIKWYEKLKNVILIVFLMMASIIHCSTIYGTASMISTESPGRFSFLFIFILLSMGYEAIANTDKANAGNSPGNHRGVRFTGLCRQEY